MAIRKSVCTHCAVGCTVTAEVANGVWIGQEPSWDSPINRGSHCAKGASVRELVSGERRLKYPLKLVDGQWTRINWDQAIDEIGDKLMAIREKSGPDSVYWLGSAKFTNEGAYLFRKLGAFWGTNNTDHQARICHSTTVTGVANTWGYGAMTNSFNDIRNSKTQIIMGGNPAEAHPVSLQHLLEGAELNRANVVVVDPRLTRTAAHATEYVRLRPGTDIPVLYGMMWHILQNGWEDKEFIAQRVYGFDDVRKEIEKWTPEEVERVSGVPGEQLKRVAADVRHAEAGDADLVHGPDPAHGRHRQCAGELHRAAAHRQCRQARHRRQHLPRPRQRAGRHRCRARYRDPAVLLRPAPKARGGIGGGSGRSTTTTCSPGSTPRQIMETPGIPLTRWFDAVLLPKDQVDQKDNVRAMFVQGHASNSITRIPESLKGLQKLDLLVVADPHPTTWASLAVNAGRKDNMYLLPACTQFEATGSRVASNRSLQWGEQIVKPIFESKNDLEIMYLLAAKLGFADKMFKNIKVENNLPVAEDILREMNRGSWSTGYCGQSPERLKLHMANQKDFDLVTMRAKDGPAKGDYYGLPWPCWGTPEVKHPGTPLLYNTNLHVMDGGGTFRARFGVERNGVNLLAEGSYSLGSEIKDGYPEFTMAVLKKLGWDKDLTPARAGDHREGRRAARQVRPVSWSTDLSGGIQRVALKHGCVPYGNAKARMNAFGLPDPIPVHREPIYTPRVDLVGEISDPARRQAVPAAEYRLHGRRRRRSTRASPSSSR